jgi:hypothetical protein
VSSAHGNLLGVVATGVTAGPGYGHYAASYYAPYAPKGKRRRQLGLRRGRRASASGSAFVIGPAENQTVSSSGQD